MLPALLQAQDAQKLLHIPSVRLPVIQQQREGDVLLYIQLRNQVEGLKDEPDVPAAEYRQLLFGHGKDLLPVNQHLPGGGVVQRAHHVQEGALPGTGFSYNRDEFPLAHGEVHMVQGLYPGFPFPVGLA